MLPFSRPLPADWKPVETKQDWFVGEMVCNGTVRPTCKIVDGTGWDLNLLACCVEAASQPVDGSVRPDSTFGQASCRLHQAATKIEAAESGPFGGAFLASKLGTLVKDVHTVQSNTVSLW